jgi:hypothetical protein
MDGVDTGQINLEAIPDGKSEEAIVSYLARYFKSVSREKLVALVKRAPVVLSRNVPATTAKKIISELERLGATAVYVAKGSEKTRLAKKEKSAADLGMPILQAFQGDLPRVPVSPLYNLGLALVAFAMLLLPLIYLGLISGVAYLLYYHATESIEVLQGLSSSRVALFTYVAPMVVGGLLVLFMIKPLFVRRAYYIKPSKIEPQDESLLFAFVQKLCDRVGAPMPSEIHLDINVNASASFRRGVLSIFANDLVLTIGLPLSAGLNLHQFAGVLAHEFGHFAQTTGMRLTYIIRSINLWFERVVYEEDEWDERIRRWSRDWDFRIGVVLLVARAHRFSLDYYRAVFGKEVMSKNLVSVEAMVKSHDKEWEYAMALNRFFQGQFTVLRPIGLPQNCIQATVDYQKIPPMLKSARKLILRTAEDYDQRLKDFNRLEIRIMEAFQNRALLDGGLPLTATEIEAMETVFQEVEEGKRLSVIDELNPFEKLVRDRMTGALQLLNVQSLAAKIDHGEEKKKTAEGFIKTAQALENQLTTVRDLQIAYQQLAVLVNQLEGKEEDEKLVRQVRVKMEDLRQILVRLRRILSETPYPFEHTQAQMTLGEFAIGKIPGKDELGPLLDGAYEAADRLFRIYARLVGRLAHLAERVENELGLPPLPEPPN